MFIEMSILLSSDFNHSHFIQNLQCFITKFTETWLLLDTAPLLRLHLLPNSCCQIAHIPSNKDNFTLIDIALGWPRILTMNPHFKKHTRTRTHTHAHTHAHTHTKTNTWFYRTFNTWVITSLSTESLDSHDHSYNNGRRHWTSHTLI